MCQFRVGEVVYVAHPFGNKPGNRRKAAAIIHRLFEKYPGVTFVSPIHGILCPYHSVSYVDGMKLCTALLGKCDVLLLTGKWKESMGCGIELKYAKDNKIKIQKLGDDFERS